MTAIEAVDDRLTEAEGEALIECESIIADGLLTFYAVGDALARIRDERLYRCKMMDGGRCATFEQYCRKRWQMSDRHARRLMDAAETVHDLESGPIGPIPTSESVLRPLNGLEPEEKREAWQAAAAAADEEGSGVTARHVAAAVAEIKPAAPDAPIERPSLTLPAAVFDALDKTYYGQSIADSGSKPIVRILGTAEHDGVRYVSIGGMSSGKGEAEVLWAYRLVTPEGWSGVTKTYAESCDREDVNRVNYMFYHGVLVQCRRQQYVMVGPEIEFRRESPKGHFGKCALCKNLVPFDTLKTNRYAAPGFPGLVCPNCLEEQRKEAAATGVDGFMGDTQPSQNHTDSIPAETPRSLPSETPFADTPELLPLSLEEVLPGISDALWQHLASVDSALADQLRSEIPWEMVDDAANDFIGGWSVVLERLVEKLLGVSDMLRCSRSQLLEINNQLHAAQKDYDHLQEILADPMTLQISATAAKLLEALVKRPRPGKVSSTRSAYASDLIEQRAEQAGLSIEDGEVRQS